MTSQNPTTDGTWTSQNGHCEHCSPGCYDSWLEGMQHFSDRPNALWADRDCPACAERARIVVLLESDDVMDVYDAVRCILHDEHLEYK